MRIQHNIIAINAYRNYTNNVAAMKKNLEKLSSGYKINRAGDDAAGLAISEKMRAQITGLETAQKNAKDGISLVQTAEGALTEVHDMLNRMVELATQSANGTYDNTTDRYQMQKEVDQLLKEINRIADSSNFNGINLLDGKLGLNTDAFKLGTVKGEDAKELAAMIKTQMPAAKDLGAATVGTDTILHKDGVEAQLGSFQLDLSQVSIAAKLTNQKADATVTILGADFDVEATNNGEELTGADIADKLKAMFDGEAAGGNKYLKVSGGTASQDTAANAAVGDLYYKASASAEGVVTFELVGVCETAGAIVDLTDPDNLSKLSAAADANVAVTKHMGAEVTVAAKTAANSEMKGAFNAANVATVDTVKPKAGQFASTVLTFDAANVKEGMTVTIAGETKTFGTDIKISDLDLTTTDGQKDVTERLVKAFENNQHVSVGTDGTEGKITIAERTDGTGAAATSKASAEMQKAMSSLDSFKKLVSFGEAAQSAGNTIELTDASALKDGNTITIKDGDTEHKYVYKKDGSGDFTTMAELQKAMEDDGIKAEIDGDKITIRAASADKNAPLILGKGLTLQIGDTAADFNQLNVSVQDMHAKTLGLEGLKINSEELAQQAIDKIKDAINTVSDVRGTLGATQNRLDHTINNLSVMTENIQDAESTIRDTDVAEEMMAYTKNNILIQSAQAMLAQANQVPQGVLQLLQ